MEDMLEDMLDGSVARKLSEEEIQKWFGPLFYISHLAVVKPKSNSTPVRIVFNSRQVYNFVQNFVPHILPILGLEWGMIFQVR